MPPAICQWRSWSDDDARISRAEEDHHYCCPHAHAHTATTQSRSWSLTALELHGRKTWNPAGGFCPACLDARGWSALLTCEATCGDSLSPPVLSAHLTLRFLRAVTILSQERSWPFQTRLISAMSVTQSLTRPPTKLASLLKQPQVTYILPSFHNVYRSMKTNVHNNS